MAKFNKKPSEEIKIDPLVEAQKKFDEAKEKFDAINSSPEFSQEEKDAVKVDFDDAGKLLEAAKTIGFEPPVKHSADTRKFFTLSCSWAHGRYPKLGIKFTNGVAVVGSDQYEAAKASTFWNREIFEGTARANSGNSVTVVKGQ